MPADNIFEYINLISQIGLTMIFSILVSFGAGYFLDIRFDTSPLYAIIFLLVGIASGFWAVYKILIKKVGR